MRTVFSLLLPGLAGDEWLCHKVCITITSVNLNVPQYCQRPIDFTPTSRFEALKISSGTALLKRPNFQQHQIEDREQASVSWTNLHKTETHKRVVIKKCDCLIHYSIYKLFFCLCHMRESNPGFVCVCAEITLHSMCLLKVARDNIDPASEISLKYLFHTHICA